MRWSKRRRVDTCTVMSHHKSVLPTILRHHLHNCQHQPHHITPGQQRRNTTGRQASVKPTKVETMRVYKVRLVLTFYFILYTYYVFESNMQWGGSTPHCVVISVLTRQGGCHFNLVRRGLPLFTTLLFPSQCGEEVDLPLCVIIPVSTWRGGSTPPLLNIIPVLTWGGSTPPLRITISVSMWWGGSTPPLRVVIPVSTWGGSTPPLHITILVSTWWGGSTPPLRVIIPVSMQWGDQPLLSATLFPFWWSEKVYPLLYILNIVFNWLYPQVVETRYPYPLKPLPACTGTGGYRYWLEIPGGYPCHSLVVHSQ